LNSNKFARNTMSKFIEQVKSVLDQGDQAKVDTMIMNYKIDD